jgi:hypothetical protein
MKIINKKFSEELIAYFPSIRHGPHRKRRVRQFFYYCVSIRCRGNCFTEPLASNNRYTYRHTDSWKIFTKYAVQMGSGVVIYVPSFIKIGSAIQKLMGGDKHKLSFIFFFQNKESGLKTQRKRHRSKHVIKFVVLAHNSIHKTVT